MTPETHAGEPPRRKGVLFCPTCGHESPVRGDWDVTEEGRAGDRHRVYECPACEAEVVAQPVFADRPGTALERAGDRVERGCRRVARLNRAVLRSVTATLDDLSTAHRGGLRTR